MSKNFICIRGARTHNLKHINLDLPRDKLIVITGLSGSGKSSLAFDTLYAEGQRRYVESLSAYIRQFLSLRSKPDVDQIEGLSPAISIEQKSVSHNPRSTVGTVTEIYDYLRLLYARIGKPFCPRHHLPLSTQTVSQMVDAVINQHEGEKMLILSPLVESRKGQYLELIKSLKAQGFIRIRVNQVIMELEEVPELVATQKHTLELVVDRLTIRKDTMLRLSESFETALRLGKGRVAILPMEPADQKNNESLILFSEHFACPQCGYSLEALEPRLFSFNSPKGACHQCDGLGMTEMFDIDRVVHDAELSLAAGAVRGWDSKQPYYFSVFKALAAHYTFSLHTPFKDLSKDIQSVILYGSGSTAILLKVFGSRRRRKRPFEGVIPNMERRYRETESLPVKEELATYLSSKPCPSCQGSRLSEAARYVQVGGKNLSQVVNLPIDESLTFFQSLTFQGQQAVIAKPIIKEVVNRLQFLVNVGLAYLSLGRRAETLSGGESQRIRLASQIGSGLMGVMYVLDEPSIGLHQRDNQRLLETLAYLRDLGNTVIVVEHDEDAIRQADHIVDIGPLAGVHGGKVVAQGGVSDIMQAKDSLTGEYLAGKRKIGVLAPQLAQDEARLLKLYGVSHHNLQAVDITLPLGLITCVTGVSGSGKSSLVTETLYPLLARALNGSQMPLLSHYDKVEGLDYLDKVVSIDQTPIGRTPRSNPATYVGLFTVIRELFSAVPESRSRGYLPGRFSFNIKGGRCESCEGAGMIKVSMHFLSDIYVACDQCDGLRYHRETLSIYYKGKTIADVLDMTVEEALIFFDAVPVLKRKLQLLQEVGLGYIRLGQSATTLSGGEAQRIKLAKELSRRPTGSTFYILDEPTTGLHFHDIQQLLEILYQLRAHGNTIVIIEHHLDVIRSADWVIDLGPEGGRGGGQVIAEGTPESIAKVPSSYTGQFLKACFFHQAKS